MRNRPQNTQEPRRAGQRPRLRALSLGAGLQSSTLLLLSCRGELPKLDLAIFADTQWEPPWTYAQLDYLEGEAAKAGIPLVRVTAGSIKAHALVSQVAGRKTGGVRWASMPYHTHSPEGRKGMIRRQCTSEYKIRPIVQELRRQLGLRPRQRVPENTVEQWLGISLDEVVRMRPSRYPWITNQYPLIDEGMRRQDCVAWLTERGLPIPARSSCVGCPFHDNQEWRRIRSDSEAWRDAVEFDRAVRNCGGMRGRIYLHHSCKPLDEVDLRSARDLGQMSLWGNECEGRCGV